MPILQQGLALRLADRTSRAVSFRTRTAVRSSKPATVVDNRAGNGFHHRQMPDEKPVENGLTIMYENDNTKRRTTEHEIRRNKTAENFNNVRKFSLKEMKSSRTAEDFPDGTGLICENSAALNDGIGNGNGRTGNGHVMWDTEQVLPLISANGCRIGQLIVTEGQGQVML